MMMAYGRNEYISLALLGCLLRLLRGHGRAVLMLFPNAAVALANELNFPSLPSSTSSHLHHHFHFSHHNLSLSSGNSEDPSPASSRCIGLHRTVFLTFDTSFVLISVFLPRTAKEARKTSSCKANTHSIWPVYLLYTCINPTMAPSTRGRVGRPRRVPPPSQNGPQQLVHQPTSEIVLTPLFSFELVRTVITTTVSSIRNPHCL